MRWHRQVKPADRWTNIQVSLPNYQRVSTQVWQFLINRTLLLVYFRDCTNLKALA